jgi:hypothetical protein
MATKKQNKGVSENYPAKQDLSGIPTEKLKAYLAKQSQQQVSGEGNQIKRVRAELQRREQLSMSEGFGDTPAPASLGKFLYYVLTKDIRDINIPYQPGTAEYKEFVNAYKSAYAEQDRWNLRASQDPEKFARALNIPDYEMYIQNANKQGVPEGFMDKLAGKIMGVAPEQPKYKIGQKVRYETSPPQSKWKDGGRGVGIITDYKNGHYMINGNPVNHFEIKGVVEQGVAEDSSGLTDIWQAGKEAAYSGKPMSSSPYKMFSREWEAWYQGWQDQKAGGQQGVSEGAPAGLKAWKKEMTERGAVKFWRDTHVGGTSMYRVVAYDKDGKVLGGFNRNRMSEGSLDRELSGMRKNNPMSPSIQQRRDGYTALAVDTQTGKTRWSGGAVWQTAGLAMGHAKAFVSGYPYMEQEYAQRFINKNRDGIVDQGVSEGTTGQNVTGYPLGSKVSDKEGNQYKVVGHTGRALVLQGTVDGKRVSMFPHQLKQGVSEGQSQVYKIVAVSKSNAIGKETTLTVEADSIEEVFERLAASDWYPLEINGVEVINGKQLAEGIFDRFKKSKPDRQRSPIGPKTRALIAKHFPQNNGAVKYSSQSDKYVLPDNVTAHYGRAYINFHAYDGVLIAGVSWHRSEEDARNPKASPLIHFDFPINDATDFEKLKRELDGELAEGLGDIVKGIKRKLAGKEDPYTVELRRYADYVAANHAGKDVSKTGNRYEKVRKLVQKEQTTNENDLANSLLQLAKDKGFKNARLRGTPEEEIARRNAATPPVRPTGPKPARADLIDRLRELQKEYDPYYDRSDDHRYYTHHSKIGNEIESIHRQLKSGMYESVEPRYSLIDFIREEKK